MKKVFILSIVLMLLTLFVKDGIAENLISPFGGLDWNDGLVDVVKKIQGIDGIEQIKIQINTASIDVKNANTPDRISESISELLQKQDPYIFDERYVNKTPQIFQIYTDSKGNEKKYVQKQIEIIANPVIISGVPFGLRIVFKMAPGFDIQYPDKVLTESRAKISLPLTIDNVKLLSSAPSLVDHKKDINDIILNKYKVFDEYGMFKPSPADNDFNSSVRDKSGNIMEVNGSDRNYYITYQNGGIKALEEIYRKHQARIAEEKNTGKKDMGSGL